METRYPGRDNDFSSASFTFPRSFRDRYTVIALVSYRVPRQELQRCCLAVRATAGVS